MSSPHPPLSRLALALLVLESTAVQALASLAVLALPAIAPKLAQALGLPAALVGVQISIAYGAAMMTSLISGTAVRRYGAVRVSQVALILAAIGALTIMARMLPVMVVGSTLIGFGYGMINPAASHLLIRATTATNRNLVFSIKQTGVPIGGTMAGAMLPPIALAFGWQWALASIAAMAVILTVALEPGRRRWDADRDPRVVLKGGSLAGLTLVWRHRGLRWLSLCGFAYAAVQLSLSAFLVTMLVTEVGWSLVQAGLVLSAVQIAGVVGRPLWGVLADHWRGGLATLMVIGAISAAAALSIGLIGPGWPAAAVLVVLITFGASAVAWNGVYLAEVARMTPLDKVSLATGASLFFTYGGVLVGPPLFALVESRIGSFTLTYALTALPAVMGVAFLAAARKSG